MQRFRRDGADDAVEIFALGSGSHIKGPAALREGVAKGEWRDPNVEMAPR
jgi:hypothetical protein